MKRRAQSGQQLLLAFDDSPKATRRIALGQSIIEYELHRVRRRTIGFQIDERGLSVRAPGWVPLREIEAAIAASERWIVRKQIEWRERRCPEAQRLRDGDTVQYLGETVKLRLDAAAGATYFAVDAKEIRLALPAFTAEPDVRHALQAWLQQQARWLLDRRLQRFAGRIDASFAGWRLSSARTQWGSCSRNGRIRLNWRLLHFSLPVIDYVIAHELAHLRELNHSRRFWNEVARLLPEFEIARDQIKRVEMAAVSF